MKTTTFLIVVAILFLAERLLPSFFVLPMSVFPIFTIVYLGMSKNFPSDFGRIAAASLLFDVFSGLPLGVFTVSIVGLGGLIYLVRRLAFADMDGVMFYVYLVIFAVVYPFAFLYFLPFGYIVSRLVYVVMEALILGALFKILALKFENHGHSGQI